MMLCQADMSMRSGVDLMTRWSNDELSCHPLVRPHYTRSPRQNHVIHDLSTFPPARMARCE